MRLSIIVAMADNGVIGRHNDLPWRLPSDLQRFKKLTMGHHLVVGRRTWESIGRPLPGRTMIVLSRSADNLPLGVRVAASFDAAVRIACDDSEVFVAGGGEIYRLALPLAQRLYVTHVHAAVDGDVTFPEVDWTEWLLSDEEHFSSDDRHSMPYTFAVYDRRSSR